MQPHLVYQLGSMPDLTPFGDFQITECMMGSASYSVEVNKKQVVELNCHHFQGGRIATPHTMKTFSLYKNNAWQGLES